MKITTILFACLFALSMACSEKASDHDDDHSHGPDAIEHSHEGEDHDHDHEHMHGEEGHSHDSDAMPRQEEFQVEEDTTAGQHVHEDGTVHDDHD